MNYNIKGARHKILVMAFVLLLIIMSFTGLVNYITFANNYNNSLVNTYAVAGNESVRKIEYALRYGKHIYNYYGMNDTLNELKEVITEVEQVNIVTPDGNILYDLNGFVTDQQLPNELLETALFQQGTVTEKLSYQFYDKKAYLFIRINDNTSHHVASLVMIFSEENYLQLNSNYTKQLAAYLAGIAIISLAILFLVFFKIGFFDRSATISKKKVLITIIAVLGSAQLFYSGINYFLFKNAYIDMSYRSKYFIQYIVDKNIESVFEKGINLQNVKGLDHYLDSIEDSLPQIKSINLVAPQVDAQQQGIKVDVTVSNDYIGQQMFKILLDMLTVLAISIFFMIELTLLAVIFMTKGSTNEHQSSTFNTRTGHGLVRSLVFLVNLAVFMSLTFVPIVMKNLYIPLLGLPKDVVLGLPLSAEMLGGILAIILASWLIDKNGWRAIFYVGVLLVIMGSLLSGFSVSALPFIFSRAIAGLGLGFIMMAIRSLVVSLPDRNTAIAQFGSGSIAGLNCGAVIGGMLADRVGYSAVFCIAALMAIIPFIFVRRLMAEFEIEKRETSDISGIAKFINFIKDRKTIIFLAGIFVPFFVGGAFLDYYFPLFAFSNGLSQSDISRGFLLNGLFIIYLGPILTRCASNKLGDTKGMVVSMFLVICALATFMVFGTLTAAFITIILLGIAESFGVSMKTSYFLNLRGIKDLEINKGIAYFSAMVNLSRMGGPIVYGVALSLGMRAGVGLITLAILLLLLVFIFFNKSQSEHKNISATG